MPLGIRQVGVLSLLLAADCRAQTAPAKPASEWAAPVDLPGMPVNRLHRFPTITAVHDTVYLAANLYPIEGTSVGPRPLYLARFPGGPIPAPPGGFQFVYPKIAAATSGEVHLVWAEFDSTQNDVLNWASGTKTALWHAVLSGGEWSAPQQALKAEWLEWPKDGGNVTVDSAGAVHVALWGFRDSIGRILHLERRQDLWRTNTTPYAPRSQVAVRASGDSVILAFKGNSYSAADTTGVMVAVSLNRGASWASSVSVHKLGERSASNLQFVRVGESQYLTWAELPPRQLGRDTLRAIRLGPALRPAPHAAVPLQAGVSTVAVAAACGNLVFLAETLSQLPQTFEGIITNEGAVVQRLLRPAGELAAFTGIAGTSQLVVAALVTRPQAGSRPSSVLMSRACLPARGR